MIGDNIKKRRKQLNLTQKQLAEKTGLTSQIISNLEREYTSPNNDDIIKLAQALQTTPNILLGIKETPKPEALMFSHIDGFSDLDDKDKKRIEQSLIEQAEFLIAKAKKNK